MAITIASDQRHGWDVVVVTGEVDIRTAPQLRDHLSALLEGGTSRLVVDLEGVDFLDSTALSVLVGAHKQLARRDGKLALVCPNEAVRRVLGITGLARIFSLHDSVDDVVAPSGANPS